MLTVFNIATSTGIFSPLLGLARSITHIQRLRQIICQIILYRNFVLPILCRDYLTRWKSTIICSV